MPGSLPKARERSFRLVLVMPATVCAFRVQRSRAPALPAARPGPVVLAHARLVVSTYLGMSCAPDSSQIHPQFIAAC